jgi:hypothetical protein
MGDGEEDVSIHRLTLKKREYGNHYIAHSGEHTLEEATDLFPEKKKQKTKTSQWMNVTK